MPNKWAIAWTSSTRELSDSVAPDDLRADFEINVPEDAELQIHDDSGSVSVTNVLGDMNVETVAAGVDLEDAAGYLTVKTVGGSFKCMRCAGRIEASSISGNFRLVDFRSYHVRAQTSTRQHPFQRRVPAERNVFAEELQRRD